MYILELFSGTKSIGKIWESKGHTVISVDLDNKFNPTHNISIFDFDYKQYNHFDYIHASPPCRWYSGLQLTFYNRFRIINNDLVYYDKNINEILVEEESDLFVKKAFEIINYFNPKYWTMENPYSNNTLALHKRPFMEDIPYTIVDYCMYNYDLRKTTVIFNNFNLQLKRCNKKHIHNRLGNNKYKNRISKKTLYERYVIPKDLCLEIYNIIYQRYLTL